MSEKLNLNYGWKFHLGKIPFDELRGHFATYMGTKAQCAQNAAKPLFYDGDFETVDLPHDYVIKTMPKEEFNESNGGYYRDEAWYRRYFKLSEDERGKRFVLAFDGAGQYTSVWVNGHFAGSNASMYNNFEIDVTPYVLYGEDVNTIAVQIKNEQVEGWWYEGAGIYRSVYLIKSNAIAVNPDGVFVKPIKINETDYELNLETNVYNIGDNTDIEICHIVLDENKKEIASTTYKTNVLFGQNVSNVALVVKNPVRWNLEKPTMHKVITTIVVNGKKVDTYKTSFGFRDIEFNVNKGFYLNGKHVKLRGVCIHQDHSQLGVAVPASIMEYRLCKLKEAGINAYRCAHNMPAREILDLCDKLGIIILDENRWFNFSERTQKELSSMVIRDRNHPCVVLWSVGNEEPLQNTLTGKELVRQMKGFIKRLDDTRPISIALNGGFFDSFAASESEVVSVNYLITKYEKMHEVHADKCLIGTESAASTTNRGIYVANDVFTGKTKDYASAYDKQRASFGSSCADAIRASEKHEFIAGTFLWTGIDYRGEAQWPMNISGAGFLDNACLEKDKFYMVKSFWKEEPMIHIMPHWDLQDTIGVGNNVTMNIYTNLDEIALFINGESQGKQMVKKLDYAKFDVIYNPGEVLAIGYKNGEEVLRKEICTTQKAAKLKVTVNNSVTNNGEDAAVIEVSVLDEKGNIKHTCDEKILFDICENGQILCTDGGDPKCYVNATNMFNGKIIAIVKVKEGAQKVEVCVNAPNLNVSEKVIIKPVSTKQINRVEVCKNLLEIPQFRRWPKTNDANAIDDVYEFTDMNTSEPVIIKNYSYDTFSGYMAYTSKTLVPEMPKGKKLLMRFSDITGEVKIKIFHDTNCWPQPTPDEFLTVYHNLNSASAGDSEIELKGFGASEKVNIVLLVNGKKPFGIGNVTFEIK